MFCRERVATCSLSSDSPQSPVDWILTSKQSREFHAEARLVQVPSFYNRKEVKNWRRNLLVPVFEKIWPSLIFQLQVGPREEGHVLLWMCHVNISLLESMFHIAHPKWKWSTYPHAEDKVRWKFLVHFWSVTAKQHCSILLNSWSSWGH